MKRKWDSAGLSGPIAASGGQIMFAEWPPPSSRQAKHVRALEVLPGHVRHDLLVTDFDGGKLIGPSGAVYQRLQRETGCHIFVLLKEGPPPGCHEEQRLVTLIGTEAQVAHAGVEVSKQLATHRTPRKASDVSGAVIPPQGHLAAPSVLPPMQPTLESLQKQQMVLEAQLYSQQVEGQRMLQAASQTQEQLAALQQLQQQQLGAGARII